MAYTAWSVVFGEQPSAAKWNQLGANDAEFNTWITGARFSVVNFTVSATGAKAITGAGFAPTCVEFFHRPATGTALQFGYGGGDGTSQFAVAGSGTTSADYVRSVTDKCLLAVSNAGAVIVDAAFTSFDADGCTLNVTTAGSSRDFTAIFRR